MFIKIKNMDKIYSLLVEISMWTPCKIVGHEILIILVREEKKYNTTLLEAVSFPSFI